MKNILQCVKTEQKKPYRHHDIVQRFSLIKTHPECAAVWVPDQKKLSLFRFQYLATSWKQFILKTISTSARSLLNNDEKYSLMRSEDRQQMNKFNLILMTYKMFLQLKLIFVINKWLCYRSLMSSHVIRSYQAHQRLSLKPQSINWR